jgi:hypothetical protein
VSDATIPVWLPRSYVESRAKQAATMPETLRLACVEALRAAHDSCTEHKPSPTAALDEVVRISEELGLYQEPTEEPK